MKDLWDLKDLTIHHAHPIQLIRTRRVSNRGRTNLAHVRHLNGGRQDDAGHHPQLGARPVHLIITMIRWREAGPPNSLDGGRQDDSGHNPQLDLRRPMLTPHLYARVHIGRQGSAVVCKGPEWSELGGWWQAR